MPRATVQTETVRKDLRTLEGGYVVLRQLSFYDMLVRRDNAMKASMGRGNSDGAMSIQFAQAWTRSFEFKHCIVEHNLEDENGNLLDFKKEETLRILDPRIASEIERYIDELNADLSEEELEGFTESSAMSSLDEQNKLANGTVETH